MTDEGKLRDRRLRLRFSCEVLFSIYFSAALLVSEESRDWSWATQIRVWYFSYFYPQSPHAIDSPYFERKIEFLLAWVIAAIAFVVLRSLYRIPNARALLRWLIGLVALIGMPATLLWTGFGNRVLLLSSIGLGVAIASLYELAMRHCVNLAKTTDYRLLLRPDDMASMEILDNLTFGTFCVITIIGLDSRNLSGREERISFAWLYASSNMGPVDK